MVAIRQGVRNNCRPVQILQTLKICNGRFSVKLSPPQDFEQAKIVIMHNDSGRLVHRNAIVQHHTRIRGEIAFDAIEGALKKLQSSHQGELDWRNAIQTLSIALMEEAANVIGPSRASFSTMEGNKITSEGHRGEMTKP